MEEIVEGVRRLVAPFFQRGATQVFVGKCCNRVFAGLEAPRRCRTCNKAPDPHVIASVDDVAKLPFLS